MKLYNGKSPNGMRVEIFIAEKGMKIPTQDVDVMKGQTRQPEHLARNSLGEVPVLELDDGSFLTESIAICRYLEEQNPEPPLFGKTAQQRAFVEMWNRRMEKQLMDPGGTVGLHEMPVFADKIEQMPAYADSQRRMLVKKLEWLDTEFADGRPYAAGSDFSVADITGMAMLMICQVINHEISSELEHVNRWATNLQARSSWPVW